MVTEKGTVQRIHIKNIMSDCIICCRPCGNTGKCKFSNKSCFISACGISTTKGIFMGLLTSHSLNIMQANDLTIREGFLFFLRGICSYVLLKPFFPVFIVR